ncbi:hypothetical protein CW713_06160 [Methanophagales archaeon]|nr:MAG: hypothetical protein CW713_06160 [Methanophagales archaeon]
MRIYKLFFNFGVKNLNELMVVGIGGSMRKEKEGFNWAKYENGGDNEIRKLAELLKSVIWQLGGPYRTKRRGMPYYPPKGMALLAVTMFMSLSERELVRQK